LVGPTAAGKTGVAQQLAEQTGRAILSADSMAVYRRLDVGTAKPSVAERARVRYFGLDLVDPSEAFSVWDYRQAAHVALASLDRPPIIVGGTGLYLKSLTHGLDDGAGADTELRRDWSDRTAAEGLAPLLAEATALAPAAVAALDGAVTFRRLIRIVERARAGDTAVPRAWSAAPVAPMAGIRVDPDILRMRIAERVRRMYNGGLVEEVAALLAEGVELSVTARQAIGYAETLDYLAGRCSRADAESRTYTRTCRLAKRQRTWFRTQAQVTGFDRADGMPDAELAARIGEYWDEQGPATLAA